MLSASLQRGKITPIKESSGYDTKPSDSEAPILELLGNVKYLFIFPLFPGSLWPGMVVLVRIAIMGQIELSNHLFYLKPFYCQQTN